MKSDTYNIVLSPAMLGFINIQNFNLYVGNSVHRSKDWLLNVYWLILKRKPFNFGRTDSLNSKLHKFRLENEIPVLVQFLCSISLVKQT